MKKYFKSQFFALAIILLSSVSVFAQNESLEARLAQLKQQYEERKDPVEVPFKLLPNQKVNATPGFTPGAGKAYFPKVTFVCYDPAFHNPKNYGTCVSTQTLFSATGDTIYNVLKNRKEGDDKVVVKATESGDFEVDTRLYTFPIVVNVASSDGKIAFSQTYNSPVEFITLPKLAQNTKSVYAITVSNAYRDATASIVVK
jgi:hypothetical protein